MISSYHVDPEDFAKDCAQLHGRLSTRGKASCGFYASADGREIELALPTRAKGKQIKRNAKSFINFNKDRIHRALAISHSRWATRGTIDTRNGQPSVRSASRFSSTFAFNGNCPGYMHLSQEHLGVDTDPSETDTITLHSLLRKQLYELQESVPEGATTLTELVREAVKFFMENVDGGHSVIWHVRDNVSGQTVRSGFRGINGNRPLSVGSKSDREFVLASESGCFPDGYQYLHSVAPGELISFSEGEGLSSFQVFEGEEELCSLEPLYLMRGNSIIDSSSLGDRVTVSEIRQNWGRAVWKQFHETFPGVMPDHIIGVPSGGLDMAEGIRDASGVRTKYDDEILILNTKGRSYISDDRDDAINLILKKFRLENAEQLNGKTVLLTDDTIVKGDTMIHGIVPKLREAGARVYVAIPSPAIRFGDDRGAVIHEESLIARRGDTSIKTDEDIFTQILGAPQGVFLSIEDLVEASGMGKLHTRMFAR